MNLKRIAILGIVAMWSAQALAVNYVQAGGPLVVIVVNLTSGFITICPTAAYGSGPGGSCVHAATLNVTGVGGIATNVQINPTPAPNGAVIITNMTNGAYVRCNTQIDGGANWVGTCLSGTAF